MAPNLFEKRFVIVAGKGGVGKSVVCAALGLVAARRGLRTCIAELNTREKAPLFFGKPPSGYAYQEIYPNLFSINILPDPALREYGLMKLRFERVYKLVFENEAMKRLLKVIPGMNELFLLGKAFNMEREKRRDGRPLWDLIIVDAPATGHGVSLLRLPDTILKVADAGPMAEEVGAMRDLLLDPRRTLVNLVTLPEEMPVRETFELANQLEGQLRMPKGFLFVNGIWPELLSETDQGLVTALDAVLPPSEVRARAGVEGLAQMLERRRFQEAHLTELADHMPWPRVELPYLFRERFDLSAITLLADTLVSQLQALEGKAA
ncbi:MAG: ArsA family ATPase [Deltaproteobacteria bacterium]|jgi:anion-transporting  ArsA/GET3 family ATPase|nr:ArsA family ATPase [Deltaproteobacteria bacterium]